MATYSATIEVPTSPQVSFEYLANLANTIEWDPGIVEATRLDEGPTVEGSRFQLVAAFFGKRIPLEYRLVTLLPGEELVFVADDKKVHSRDVIRFVPLSDGTKITYDASLSLRGPVKLLDKGLNMAFSNIGDKAVAGLKKKLN